jgi:hypothetical protein
MTDLDEREDGVDAILRSSGTNLRTAMAHSAIPDFRRPRGSVRRRWVISVATVGVLIAGLVAIGTNRNDQSVGNDPSRLHYLVTSPPDGLPLVFVSEPGTQHGPTGATVGMNVYATETAPLGPILSVNGSAGSPDLEVVPAANGTNFQETTIDGRRAAFADGETGQRLLYIEDGGHWAVLTARNIDDATLSTMASAVLREADGSAAIPTTALLDGLTLVVPADAPIEDLTFGTNFSGLSYANPDGRSIALQVYPPRLSARAMFGLQVNLTATKVKGADGFVGSDSQATTVPHADMHLLLWERDGLEFRMTGFNVTDAQMVAAAESVEHASDAEWSGMLQQTGLATNPGAAPAGTVPAEPAPAGTDPPSTGDVKDASMDVAVTDTSPNEQTWSGTLPTGETWKVEVKRVFDSISMQPEVDGLPQGLEYGPVARQPGEEFGCCTPLSVITADTNAAAMRVTTHDGDRFTIPLQDLPGTGLRIAVVALANGSGPQLAELLDVDGNVLASQP